MTLTATPIPGAASTALAIASLLDPTPVLTIMPILHPQDGVPDPRSRTFCSAVAKVLYIQRQRGTDLFGPTPGLTSKLAQGNDLVACGRRGPMPWPASRYGTLPTARPRPMVAEWALHALADEDGRWIKRPHLHVILTHRFWRACTRVGQPNAAWLGTPRHRQRMMDA